MNRASSPSSPDWPESNQRYLAKSIDQVRLLLKKSVESGDKSDNGAKEAQYAISEWNEDFPPAIESVCSFFGLSAFEKHVLLLCAGVELYGDVSRLCAVALGNADNMHPTFGLALAVVPGGHWSAILPTSPLRKFGLIDLQNTRFDSLPLVSRPIRIEERVLHYLAGLNYLEPALEMFAYRVSEDLHPVESHKNLVDLILRYYENQNSKLLPVVQLVGSDRGNKLEIAKQVCKKMGCGLYHLDPCGIRTREDSESFVKIWRRESALLESGLYVSFEHADPRLQRRTVARLMEDTQRPVFLDAREQEILLECKSISVGVKKPTRPEQRLLWESHLEPKGDGFRNLIPKLTNQFNLNASEIMSLSSQMNAHFQPTGNNDAADLFDALWNLCLEHTSPKVDIAQRIAPKASMGNLVLPCAEKQLLKEIVAHVRHRTKVYEEWGFGNSGDRGLGVTVLFSGPSGTGKTMAAEVLANELHLNLFRIDLSKVVSKYIGETEKNLGRVFDSAEEGGAVLFFDEADALFGKRTEVRDSHDRYANIEINYLLQRVESYGGVAILSTNMKGVLDSAFLRRIRFSIEFPFPNEESRREIWERVFPRSVPLCGVDFLQLARLNVGGGNIRNIAMNAAFLAAEEGGGEGGKGGINMMHLKRAAEIEFLKLHRPMTKAELGIWGDGHG